MNTLLLENNPSRCNCGGIVDVYSYGSGFSDDFIGYACCAECGFDYYGATLAEAEMGFFLAQNTPKTVIDQAIDFGCLVGFEGDLVCCAVEGASREYTLPPLLARTPRLGCILVATSDDEDWIAGRHREYCSLILFRPCWWPEAWSLARRLRHSSPGCAALVGSQEIEGGIFIALSRQHRLVIDGQEVRP